MEMLLTEKDSDRVAYVDSKHLSPPLPQISQSRKEFSPNKKFLSNQCLWFNKPNVFGEWRFCLNFSSSLNSREIVPALNELVFSVALALK